MTIGVLFQNRHWITLGILFAFDDISFLANYGGPYLASPAWIMLVPLLIRLKPIHLSTKTFSKLASLFLFIICISLIQYSQISLSGVDQSILLKIVKNVLEMLVYLMFVFLGFRTASKQDGRIAILSTGIAFYSTSLLGFLIEKYFIYFSYEDFFHATTNIQQRARGFRFEASSLGSAFLIAAALVLICFNGKKLLIALCVLIAFPFSIVQSRGYFLAVTIVICIVLFRLVAFFMLRDNQVKSKRTVFEVLALLVMIFGLPLVVQTSIWENFSADVSDTTRSMWSLMVFFVLLNFPFGMGFGNSVVLLPDLISEQIVPYMQGNFSGGNYSEIAFILASKSDSGMYPKTLPGYIILVSGWIGATIFLYMYWRIVRECVRLTPAIGFPIYVGFFLLISVSSTYFGSSFSWDQAFLFGVLYGLIKMNREAKLKEIHASE